MQVIANTIPALVPVLALAWAIIAYYRKRADDRSDEASAERRQVYRDFLAQTEQAMKVPRGEDWHQDGRIVHLWALNSEIDLLASDEIREAASALVVSVNDFFMSPEQRFMGSDGVLRGRYEHVAHNRTRLVEVMRTDINRQ